MTPERQRIVIAEACNVRPPLIGTQYSHDGNHCSKWEYPNYTGDLNMIHEAELTLWNEPETVERYRDILQRLYLKAVGYSGADYWWMAGPQMRAEAYIRAKGLWEDE